MNRTLQGRDPRDQPDHCKADPIIRALRGRARTQLPSPGSQPGVLDSACPGAILGRRSNSAHLEVPPMPHFRSVPRLVALSVLALACKTGKSFDRTTQPGGRPLSTTTTGSLIISGRALSADPGRTVLDAIRHAMPQPHIAGSSQHTHCPTRPMPGEGRIEAHT